MQCLNCGRPLQPDDATCPLCGQPVDLSADQQPTNELVASTRPGALQIGEPEDPFANTVFGGFASRGRPATDAPPQPNAPFASTTDPGTITYAAPLSSAASRPAVPSPGHAYIAIPHRSLRWLPLLAVCCACCVVAVLVAGALASSGQWWSTLASGPARATAPAQANHLTTSTTQSTAACPLAAVDAHAAQALEHVQLATGIQSPQTDLPIDRVTAFHVGQTAYVSFALATNNAGTLAGSICTNGQLAARTLAVPAGRIHLYGEFNLPTSLTVAQVGPGSVILTWNGAVASAIAFTVTLH